MTDSALKVPIQVAVIYCNLGEIWFFFISKCDLFKKMSFASLVLWIGVQEPRQGSKCIRPT